jgi:pyruvate kinase
MLRAGVDVVRLNTSHGTVASHTASIGVVRKVAEAEGKTIAVLMDLGGPKLRTGPTKDGRPIELVTGARVRIVNRPVEGTEDEFSVEYPRLPEDVLAGEHILLDDGAIELEVDHATPAGLEAHIVHGGQLAANKGVSFPHSNLTMPALTDRDREAIKAGVEAEVDFFALSFVRDAGDIALARSLIAEAGGDIPIIAKIERRQAVAKLEEIMSEADGAMVARGDLGVELAPEDVPVQQRRIIAWAALHMIPVITATQMLESMVHSPRPTRAESSDVANAVWERSDAVMLSEETAMGSFPVEAVAMMDRIICKAEEAETPDTQPAPTMPTDDHAYIIALAARRIVESDTNMRGIVCFTRSGHTAFLMSKVHANVPIFALTPTPAVHHRLSLARGVIPLLAPPVTTSQALLESVDRLLLSGRRLAAGEEVVIIGSLPVGVSAATNFLKLHRVGESSSYVQARAGGGATLAT